MKTKLFLDTSIPSAPFDLSKPMRNHITTQWFLHDVAAYDIYTSSLAIQELKEWSNETKQQGALDLLEKNKVQILDIQEDMEFLAEEYIRLGALPMTEKDDALHLACAALSNVLNFVSWDFRHIVSVNPILKIREVHQKMGLPPIQISTLSPFGGNAYGVFEPAKFAREKHKIV